MDFKGLLTGAWAKVEPKIESKVNQVIDVQFRDKQLIADVCAHLLKKYGNEVYYNDLDSYITSNHVIELLIQSIRGVSTIQPKVAREFKNSNTQKFLKYNPKYKSKKVIVSRISSILKEIFDIVHSGLLTIDPHSELGKIQRDLHITGDTLSGEHQEINAQLERVEKTVLSMQSMLSTPSVSTTSYEESEAKTEAVERFTKLIKEIEETYQQKHQYSNALAQYYALLQNIATSLAGHSKEQINKLICTLNCNIALCQSNLGLPKKALESLSAIPHEAAQTSKVYHLVYALIYVQQNDIANYQYALDHINAALQLDANYHNAFAIRQFLLAHIKTDELDDIVKELDDHYIEMLTAGTDRGKISEYYQFRGLINLHGCNYSLAINDFNKAMEYGYDQTIARLNIALTMYAEATNEVPKDCRLLLPPIDQSIMMKAVDALKDIIDALKGNVDYDDVRKRAAALYVSACSTLGKKHELTPLSDFIYEGQEYEQLRVLLLGAAEQPNDKQLGLLSQDDRLFILVRNLMRDNDAQACKEYIVGLIDTGVQSIPAPVFHVLLQVCLITQTPDDYWKYRQDAENYGIDSILCESMDACAYELQGNISGAKEIFNRIASQSTDDNILENALRFFLRNDCVEESRDLFLRMHNLIVCKAMYITDAEPFYREVTRFLISQKDQAIEKILMEIPDDLISKECKTQLYASYYSSVSNLGELYNCLSAMSCDSGEFENAFRMALCAAQLFKYDDALRICLALEKRTSNTEDKVKVFWLISDVFLLQDKKDESFSWAKKAHELTSQNPFDRSHQAFFARSFRCDHHEAIGEVVEYQKTHPVVVNWIKTFSISEENGDVVDCLKKAVKEFNPDHDSYEENEREIAKFYKQGILPFNAIHERYHGDLGRLFTFATDNKINIALGDNKTLLADINSIGTSIVIDALTLIVLAKHNCLDVLTNLDNVFINYRTSTMLQQAYISEGSLLSENILSWLQKSKNIVYEADGFVEEDNITQLFSHSFVSCCNIAVKNSVPFLYCDVIARKFQSVPGLNFFPQVTFVSIPAICNKMFATEPERLSDALYSFLQDCTFVSFRAETILCQIRKQNYVITKEYMAPFMFCDTACDMSSFARVYLGAIRQLVTEEYDAAVDLANIVIEDAVRIWRRGTYYRQIQMREPISEAAVKAYSIEQYIFEILRGIEDIFESLPKGASIQFDKLALMCGYRKEE